MAIMSNSVVLIKLKNGHQVVSDEKIGMNLDEIDIKGCLEAEGRVNVFHLYGGHTAIHEEEVDSIQTIHETIHWAENLEWVDSSNDEPSDFFMQSVSSSLSFSAIQEHYAFGFYLRERGTTEALSIETIRSLFKFIH